LISITQPTYPSEAGKKKSRKKKRGGKREILEFVRRKNVGAVIHIKAASEQRTGLVSRHRREKKKKKGELTLSRKQCAASLNKKLGARFWRMNSTHFLVERKMKVLQHIVPGLGKRNKNQIHSIVWGKKKGDETLVSPRLGRTKR